MTTHQRLFEEAYQAINAVFSDQSVSHEQILESIELLGDEVGVLIDAIGEEIERAALNKKYIKQISCSCNLREILPPLP